MRPLLLIALGLLAGCATGRGPAPVAAVAPGDPIVVGAPPASPNVVPRLDAPVPSASLNVEFETHALVNRHRSERGRPGLVLDDTLSDIAREHSIAMATGRVPFSHDGFDARSNAAAAYVPHEMFAENVAQNSNDRATTAEAAVAMWLSSPMHRRNIEGPYTLTGIGHAVSEDGMNYYTQIFVKPAR